MMILKKGDFILINYTARVKETNEVFDTTLEEVAKKEHLYKEGEIYEPKLVVIGEGWMLKAEADRQAMFWSSRLLRALREIPFHQQLLLQKKVLTQRSPAVIVLS